MSQVCSQKIAPKFSQIGEKIHIKYQDAHFNIPHQREIENISQDSIENLHKPLKIKLSKRRARDTIFRMEFHDLSPDYCKRSKFALGTSGRKCRAKITAEEYERGIRSCRDICCFGWETKRVKKVENKDCVFKYCCTVTCATKIEKWVLEYVCL